MEDLNSYITISDSMAYKVLQAMTPLYLYQEYEIPEINGLYFLWLKKRLFYIGMGKIKAEVNKYKTKRIDKILYCKMSSLDIKAFESYFITIFDEVCINTNDFLDIKILNKKTIFENGLKIINKKLDWLDWQKIDRFL